MSEFDKALAFFCEALNGFANIANQLEERNLKLEGIAERIGAISFEPQADAPCIARAA